MKLKDGPEPSSEVAVTLFRCVRELLLNIIKHAGVRKSALRIWRTGDGTLKIEVSDEGTGFDPKEVRAREGVAGGFGLFSIRERLEWLGGGLDIESAPGSGSRFTLWVPVQISRAAGGKGASPHSSTGSARSVVGGAAGS